MLPAAARAALSRENAAAATSNTGLRPKMSEKDAQMGVLVAEESRYADPIQVYAAGMEGRGYSG